MLASEEEASCLGRKEDSPGVDVDRPPPVTITGVRIPADGSRAHLVSLTKTPDGVSGGMDCFLFHVPDLRQYWKSEKAWLHRQNQRMEFKEQPHPQCDGLYYAFFSHAVDDLPQNMFVPKCIGTQRAYWGDVFVVKLAREFGEHGWAAYADVLQEFLELQLMDPSFEPTYGPVLPWDHPLF